MLTTTEQPALGAPECDFFHEYGYLIVRDVFPAELMAEAAREAETLLERRDLMDVQNLRCRWQTNVHTGECTFETFDPVIDLSPVCERIAFHPRLLAIL